MSVVTNDFWSFLILLFLFTSMLNAQENDVLLALISDVSGTVYFHPQNEEESLKALIGKQVSTTTPRQERSSSSTPLPNSMRVSLDVFAIA